LLAFSLTDPRIQSPYFIATSAAVIPHQAVLKAGWVATEPLINWRRQAPVTGDSLNRPFDRFDRYLHWWARRVARSVSVASSPRIDDMADLVSRIGHDGRIRHVRDATYFQWRFQNPRAKYRFIYLHRSRLRAYLVLQHRVAPRSPYHPRLVDWEAETPEDLQKLLEAFERLGLGRVELCSGALLEPDRALFRRAGFTERPQSTPTPRSILISPGAGANRQWRLGGRDVRSLANWDFRELYSDGV
jgi:hypothetical protein